MCGGEYGAVKGPSFENQLKFLTVARLEKQHCAYVQQRLARTLQGSSSEIQCAISTSDLIRLF